MYYICIIWDIFVADHIVTFIFCRQFPSLCSALHLQGVVRLSSLTEGERRSWSSALWGS